jgi:hypothetical protein
MRSLPTIPFLLVGVVFHLGHFTNDIYAHAYAHALDKTFGATFGKSVTALTSHPPQRKYHWDSLCTVA